MPWKLDLFHPHMKGTGRHILSFVCYKELISVTGQPKSINYRVYGFLLDWFQQLTQYSSHTDPRSSMVAGNSQPTFPLLSNLPYFIDESQSDDPLLLSMPHIM